MLLQFDVESDRKTFEEDENVLYLCYDRQSGIAVLAYLSPRNAMKIDEGSESVIPKEAKSLLFSQTLNSNNNMIGQYTRAVGDSPNKP